MIMRSTFVADILPAELLSVALPSAIFGIWAGPPAVYGSHVGRHDSCGS